MAEPRTWAIVTTGVRARILRGLERGDSHEFVELIRKAPATHLRRFLTDRAGRSFASDRSGRRSAMEPGSDPIRRDMQDFARELLGIAEEHHRAGDFEHLAIIAAPKMLGILRSEMPASLRDAVVLERAANLTGVPEAELRAILRRLLYEIPAGDSIAGSG